MTKPPTPRAMTSTTAVRTILIVLGFLVVGVGVPEAAAVTGIWSPTGLPYPASEPGVP